MGWARFDDRRAMNGKLREAGFAARGLDEAAICQVAADMSDGHISRKTVEMLAAAHGERRWQRLVDVLVKVGRWEVNGAGWYIHDYLEYNPSRAAWLDGKAKKQAAGRRGGQASASARGQPSGEANAQADPSPSPTRVSQSQSLLNPMPRNAETETGTSRAETETTAALAHDISALCQGRNRTVVNIEAAAVVAWCYPLVDRSLIEESIFWFRQQSKPPDLPRAIAGLIATKAADRHVQLPTFQLPLRRHRELS